MYQIQTREPGTTTKRGTETVSRFFPRRLDSILRLVIVPKTPVDMHEPCSRICHRFPPGLLPIVERTISPGRRRGRCESLGRDRFYKYPSWFSPGLDRRPLPSRRTTLICCEWTRTVTTRSSETSRRTRSG